MSINFSIIIPHKNTPDLLVRCLNSIPNRKDIQIIVVDDNSNNINWEEVKIKSLIHFDLILTKCNKGGGYARNVGIINSRGKWILFSDADDYFFTNRLIELMNKYESTNDVDVVYLNAISYKNHTDELSSFQPRIYTLIQDSKLSIKQRNEYIRFKTWEPWTRMCRRDFIFQYNIRFDEIPRQNDITFGIKTSIFSHKYRIETDIIYCWVSNIHSISRKKPTKESFINLLNIDYKINQLYIQEKLQQRICFLQYIFSAYKLFGIEFTISKVFSFLLKNKINPLRGFIIFYFRQRYRFPK